MKATAPAHPSSPWNWEKFRGSPPAIKYLKRDLPALDTVLGLTRGRTACVQAGGHLGAFPKYLARHFAIVYTFEPAPDLFALLMQNAPERNIIKLQAAVGDAHRLIGLSRVRRATSVGPIHEGLSHVAGEGAIPMLCIDDLNLPICELLLLDIEGSEMPALRGAVDTIARCRPLLVVENNKNQAFVGHTNEELRAFVATLGYRQIARLMSDDVFAPTEWVMD
jgi:FkbM family methyltransferase